MDINKYISTIPKIRVYEEDLEKQNLWWTVVAMVGKINNQGLEPQLLDSVVTTQAQFDNLKRNLIESLVKRYLNRAEIDLALKARAFINILNRNLFERTADVGFLATDDDLIQYLSLGKFTGQPLDEVTLRLQAYVNKYSVYDDVLLLTPDLKVVASLNGEKQNLNSTCQGFNDALISEGYIEYDQTIDVFGERALPLFFIQRIISAGQVVGLLCLSFQLEDELERIASSLSFGDQRLNLALLSESNQCLFNARNELSPLPSHIEMDVLLEVSSEKGECWGFVCQASGYQGYQGLPWKAYAYSSVHEAVTNGLTQQSVGLSRDSEFFPADLHALNLEINTALLIVILNGKISSLKNNVKAFLPVLDSFQDIGSQIRQVFSESIEHIHHVTHQTESAKADFSAATAIDVMDRNLYERANDCRWWALETVFLEVLSYKTTDLSSEQQAKMTALLESINVLYTVYESIYIYDQHGTVVAVSNSAYQNQVGINVFENSSVKDCLNLTDSEQYCVSKFTHSDFYKSQLTYEFHAKFFDKENQGTLGGIGLVFDAHVEFKAILDDFLPRQVNGQVVSGGFAVFVEDSGLIVAVTENRFGLQEGAFMQASIPDFCIEQAASVVSSIMLEGESYILARKTSQGYREYKNSDGYSNPIHAYVFVKD